MNNTILIVSSIVLAFFLLLWSPYVGPSVAFLVISVLLFRGIYLLTDIQKRLSQITTNPETEIENQEKAEVNQKA